MLHTAIVWFRRDLRLADNPALLDALSRAKRVIPLYIHAPEEEEPWKPGAASEWWLHHSLASLSVALREKGSKLVIRQGSSQRALQEIAHDTKATLVCWNRQYEPAVRSRDETVEKALFSAGIEVSTHPGSLLREPGTVLKDDGEIYRVFTPFYRRYLLTGPEAAPVTSPVELPPLPQGVHSIPLEDLHLVSPLNWHSAFGEYWQPGEEGAKIRLQNFIDSGAISKYGDQRDLPYEKGVSELSPYLHFGEVSARQIWHDAQNATRSFGDPTAISEMAESYLRQLIWREFAHHLLYHLPHTPEQPFDDRFSSFGWERNPDLFSAWTRGQTGIPLVDAGMRQLWQIGWMHNRIRMLVASVLTKNGLVHWLEGARWFWDTLLDADLANNTMGWQWVAGCGVDAAPYFRVFSPARQGERFDAEGKYVRIWVPELAELPNRYIHEPWRAPASVLEQAKVTLGNDYPFPVLDLASGREEALRRFQKLR